jgi:plasmid maintenance system antidote protein VapI
LESTLIHTKITFTVLRERLIEEVKSRIDNGEFTERGLSRILGISQSQAHNVLKGARTLQLPLADRILAKLDLSTADLLNEVELNVALQEKRVRWDKHPAEPEPPAIKKPPVRSVHNRLRQVKRTG